jgi:ATP-dependent exoDNAse (exonuclease V) beta subunit
MSKTHFDSLPSDQHERERALDPTRSILVQAPAGSGKTDLLTRRFLRLLTEVEHPGQIVAITFTNAAAAEMRHRILGELEKAASASPQPIPPGDNFSMDALAQRALEHSDTLGWRLLDLPAQLRIRTIDSFCRELALQQPLLSGFGGTLEIAEQPDELYRRAARETLRKVDQTGSALSAAVENLLLWRDNGWQELEETLVEMLKNRDRWMHGFLLEREPNWKALREQLERPFANAVRDALNRLSHSLDQLPGVREEALALARFACEQSGGLLHRELAELVELPPAPVGSKIDLDELRQAYLCLADLLLTTNGAFRKTVDKRLGFPADRKTEKGRILALIVALDGTPGLETALSSIRTLPPPRYTEEDWKIVQACFTLLRHAAGELKIAFAEAGRVDYSEVAQIAERVLRGEDGFPTDSAIAVSDGIRHLLVDEFQDTSRRQHQLLSSLIAAWPERQGRTCFVVGDPMQSIYFFREADAELFAQVKAAGLELAGDQPLLFDFVPLKANFRTEPTMVERLNRDFEKIFASDDGSGVTFSSAQPAREATAGRESHFALHLNFVSQTGPGGTPDEKDLTQQDQIAEVVDLIRRYQDQIERARSAGESFRIAVLGRARAHLAPIAAALREARIPFRAIELEKLAARSEVLDALALARALFNPQDRLAWLGVLRAPFCGLSLEDLHTVAGDADSIARPVPELVAERLPLLSETGRSAARRLLDAIATAVLLRSAHPAASLGTWLEAVWLRVGGSACVDSTAQANLDLLWGCLDQLPGGEADLLGPTLRAALDRLTALPDAQASSDCGVQLMTIHKSKGLEFEVVIVPELQARIRSGRRKMLSWLERGLARPNESGEITEFLVAPFQQKGKDRGEAKAWVDRVYRERERQEDRRILYVAATRAREELHFFAHPAYEEENGTLVLVPPSESLLATAWPALQEEIHARFDEWKAMRPLSPALEETEIASIAASAEKKLLVMPSPSRPALLRRLPPDYTPQRMHFSWQASADEAVHGANGTGPLYTRHEGGLLSRALGAAVHRLLEEMARLRNGLEWEAVRSALLNLEPRIAALVRAAGVGQARAAEVAAEARQTALKASYDPIGAWILSPHADAASEEGWAGLVKGAVRTVQVDRVFRAGPAPGSEAGECWWIIDYKTAHSESADPKQALRELFAPQVETYGQVLRNLRGAEAPIFAGLYYPRMSVLDWWPL